MSRMVLLLVIGVCANSVQAELRGREVLRPFLKSYCIKCHGSDKQKADRRFDRLAALESGVDNAELLQEILDQLLIDNKIKMFIQITKIKGRAVCILSQCIQ